MSDPFVPAVQSLYWVQTSMLPLADREEQRAVAGERSDQETP